MKFLVVGLVLIALVVGGISWVGEQMDNAGMAVQIAFGEPSDNIIPMDMVLTAAMANASPPAGDARYSGVWQQWVKEHITLTHASGNSISCEYQNASAFVGPSRLSQDVGYLHVNLEVGGEYLLTYQAKPPEGPAYRGSITAPAERRSTFFLTLQTVDGD